MPKTDDPFTEWREVQDHRYDKGFYPGSGKINPFFRKAGRPDRRFGYQLLVVSLLSVLLQFVFPLTAAGVVGLYAFGGICLFGGLAHLWSTRS